jgi:hypothetical protein
MSNILLEDIPAPGKKRVAVIIGRFNPPTKGHYELINEVRKYIKSNPTMQLEAMPVVAVIGNDKKRKDADDLLKNPLTVNDRVVFMQSSGHANGVKFITATNAFEALTKCRSEGLEPIAIAAGTDRIDDYIRILDQYFKDANDKPIKHVPISLERDEGAIETKKVVKADNIDDQLSAIKGGEDVTTDIVSGSLARRAAELGYFEEFSRIVGLDHNKKLATLLYNKVKKVLDLANQQKEQEPSKKLKESVEDLPDEIEQIVHSIFDTVKRKGNTFLVPYSGTLRPSPLTRTQDVLDYMATIQVRPDMIIASFDGDVGGVKFLRNLHTDPETIPKDRATLKFDGLISQLSSLESVRITKITQADKTGNEHPFDGKFIDDKYLKTVYFYYEDKK